MTQDRPDDTPASQTAVSEALQALGPAVERGRHLALVASEGDGLESLYAAAIVRDLGAVEEPGRAFVLTASYDRALRCAGGMHETTTDAGLGIMVLSPEAVPLGADGGGADILLGSPAILLEEIRTGRLSGEGIRTVILDDVRALDMAWPAVEAILQACDTDARRVAATHLRDDAFDDVVKHWLPRARRWPAELFEEAKGNAPGRGPGQILCATRSTSQSRLARLVELLHEVARSEDVSSVRVHAAAQDVDRVAAALSVSGFHLAPAGDPDGVHVGEWKAGEAQVAIAFGLPDSMETLGDALASAGARYAIVDAVHEPRLVLLAQRLGWSIAPLPEKLDASLTDEAAAFRALVARALKEQDLATGTLLLAPLLEEHGAGRVAAALAGLVRSATRRAAEPARPAPKPEGSARPAPSASAERVTRPTWTRVFIDVGKRDGAGPGDLLGAITGEAKVAGGQIGRIDIRQGFTLVDVDSLVADDVVRGLHGSRIKGRQVVARLDRDKGG